MLFSILYLILRGLLGLVPLPEDGRDREVEILVLRHQLKVLGRKSGRPKLRRLDRVFLSAAARKLPRERWVSFLVGLKGSKTPRPLSAGAEASTSKGGGGAVSHASGTQPIV